MFKTADVNVEKHVPQIIKMENGYKVVVGKPALHPMTPEHYITNIVLTVDGKAYAHNLNHNDQPMHIFEVEHGTEVFATENCNLHGSWINNSVE